MADTQEEDSSSEARDGTSDEEDYGEFSPMEDGDEGGPSQSEGQTGDGDDSVLTPGKRPRLGLDVEELDSTLLNMIKCGICFYFMTPPSLMCVNGHSICNTCREKVQNKCPFCKGSLSKNHNFALEGIMDMLKYPCKHNDCSNHYLLKEKDAHEQTCVFRPYSCFKSGCNWRGANIVLVDHLKDKHLDCFYNKNLMSVVVSLDRTIKMTSFLHCHDEIFVVCLLSNSTHFHVLTIFIGPHENAKNFVYQTKIFTEKKSPDEIVIFKREVLPSKHGYKTFVKKFAGVAVDLAFMKNFTKSGRLLVDISVEPRPVGQIKLDNVSSTRIKTEK